eukprot:CAMPEP_0197022942 /NCGR_PEP_ID=MMETSP1384-20130603/3736_1 /TAXON_ID=29189 /ORGANISM="Ammonia sp." /LENGTH=377 /DNA_ID=CAMNT_0042451069 /DNA_START=33 /DNA_END=1166 /DNA_ORIENTATION=-
MARTKGKSKSKRNIQHKEYLPWVEKYRPRKIDDIAHQTHVVSTLKNVIQTSNLTHLLFYGPPGTGKTSTILALARQLYGPNLIKSRILELNASDERGINVVRSKIKSFAQHTVNRSSKEPGFPCPPYKIIILDEADSMTRDAQTALRRTMEKYSNITRFCLICNYVSRIIAPVASRCSKFRFESLNQESMMGKLSEIASAERINISRAVLDDIITMSEGDMRKSITLLQTASLMRNVSMNEAVTSSDVYTVCVRIPDEVIYGRILPVCTKANGSFNEINDCVHQIVSDGYPVNLILPQLLQMVMQDQEERFSNLAKSKIALKIAKADKCLVDGASELLQLLDVLACIQQNVSKNSSVSAAPSQQQEEEVMNVDMNDL